MRLTRPRDIPSLFTKGLDNLLEGFTDFGDAVEQFEELSKNGDYTSIKSVYSTLFDSLAGSTKNTDTTVAYSFDVPGISKEDIKEAKVDKSVLNIKASRGEREYSFTKIVGKDVDQSKSSLTIENGVLTITFQKKTEDTKDTVDLLK